VGEVRELRVIGEPGGEEEVLRHHVGLVVGRVHLADAVAAVVGEQSLRTGKHAIEVVAVVQRIEQVDVARRDELVLDEDSGRHRLVLQHSERQGNEFVAVALREVGDGADETRAAAAQLIAQRSLAPTSSKACRAARAQMSLTQPMRVRRAGARRRYWRMTSSTCSGSPQPLRWATGMLAAPGSSARRPSIRPVMRSSSSERAMGSSSITILVDLAFPVLARPAAKSLAADEAGLVVVGAEVSRAGVGDLDGDDGSVRLKELRCDDRGDALVGLVLEDEINALLDQQVSVAQGLSRGVSVVDPDEVDVLARGGRLHRLHHGAAEGRVALRGKADAEGPRSGQAEAVCGRRRAGALQQAAVYQACAAGGRRWSWAGGSGR
jgi:hypothetical protein